MNALYWRTRLHGVTHVSKYKHPSPHVEQLNVARRLQLQSHLMKANDGMNALQVPTSSWRPGNLCTSWRASHPTFIEMLIGKDHKVEESIGDGGYEIQMHTLNCYSLKLDTSHSS